MVEIIRMPEVLAGASEAAIQTWLVGPGSSVSLNQTIAEIETDKAVVDYQAEFSGTVGRLLADEGISVAVGDPILVLVEAGEGDTVIDAALSSAGAHPGGASSGTETSAIDAPPIATEASALSRVPAGARIEEAASEPVRRLFASPLVRRLAGQHGVDLSELAGSGPNGRIVRRDLDRHLESRALSAATPGATAPVGPRPAASVARSADVIDGRPASVYEDIPIDRMRKAIARRLTESKSTVPHFYLAAHCRVDALLALRTQINEGATRKISVNDLVVKAVAGALTEVPEANATWNGDNIRRYRSADISVAVAIEGGLSTPVIRDVGRLSLGELSASIADAASRARNGSLRQHELEGGSFSVSNLGMHGVAEFTAILNPPQAGIIAVGAARRVPSVEDGGQLGVASVMTVTLSADHRVLDGAIAAQWLAAFQRRIENPLTILV